MSVQQLDQSQVNVQSSMEIVNVNQTMKGRIVIDVLQDITDFQTVNHVNVTIKVLEEAIVIQPLDNVLVKPSIPDANVTAVCLVFMDSQNVINVLVTLLVHDLMMEVPLVIAAQATL